MEIVYDSLSPVATLKLGELLAGRVYTDVSDGNDDDLYMYTDMGDLVNLRDGTRYTVADPWTRTASFLEVNVKLVVKK